MCTHTHLEETTPLISLTSKINFLIDHARDMLKEFITHYFSRKHEDVYGRGQANCRAKMRGWNICEDGIESS